MHKMTLQHTLKSQIYLNEHHDNCTICNRHFTSMETTHLGYDNNRNLLHVGNCCSSKLRETIIRHPYAKRPYDIPDNDATLWRFMDFTKFVSMLSSKSLYFTRADKFDDPFEGAKGIIKNKKQWDKHYLSFFESAIRNPPKGLKCNKTDSEIKKEAKRLLNQMDSIGQIERKTTYINCWHENSYESEAMWKLYTTNLTEGIAIQTTYGSLYKTLKKYPSINIGRVNYIDFTKRFVGINESFWYKRKSFEHEKEIRAILINHSDQNNDGLGIKLNLNILFHKIYISPFAKDWFVDLVNEVISKYGLTKKVNSSKMKIEPFH